MRITKKTLFTIHGWLGLNLGLLLFVICFSGTFAVLSNEADWLLDPALRIKKQERPIAWEAMYQNVKSEFPEGHIASLSEQKNPFTEVGDYFAYTAFVQTPQGQTLKVHIDPYTGKVKGHNSFFDVQRFFRNYHSFFFDSRYGGTLIVTFMAFFLLFSVLTGFLFYKKWFRNLFQLRFKKGLRVFFADAHRQFGVWSLLFSLIIALTGIFYFVEDVLGITGNFQILVPDTPGKLRESELAAFGNTPRLLPLDTYADNAKKAFPELRVETLRIPSSPNEYVYIDGQDGNPFTRDRANRVYLHPFTGGVEHIQKASDLSVVELITDVVDIPHFGTFGGLTVKIIWFVFGLALSFSILAGTYIWYNRKVNRLTKKSKNSILVPGTRISFWQKLGSVPKIFKGALIATMLTLFYLIVTGTIIITDGIRNMGPFPKERTAQLQDMQLGPWSFTLECQYPCTLEKGTRFMARFKGEGIPNYGQMELQLISATDSILKIPFTGPSQKPRLIIPEDVGKLKYNNVSLSIETLTGKKFEISIDEKKLTTAVNVMNDRFADHPERTYPDVPIQIYLFIVFFTVLTIVIIGVWTYYVIKASLLGYGIENKSV